MELRTVRRGLVVVTATALLGLAGASPASAAEPGWLEQGLRWLTGFWATESSAAKARPDGGLVTWAMSTTEKGMGLDPNGDGSQSVDPPPTEDE